MPMSYADRLSEDGLCIFLFHGVVERSDYEVRNYNRKHLEHETFAVILSQLEKRGRPVSMEEVIHYHKTGKPFPPRAFAVTFDDGFANNVDLAAPILADLGIPATFYVTSGFVEGNRMSWIDRIEWAFEATPMATVRLPWADGPVAFATPEEKRTVLDDIRRNVKSDQGMDVNGLASGLQRQCGLPETWTSDDPLDRKLTWRQVQELAEHPMFTVGGHSHSHAILSFLDDDGLAEELDVSIALLRDEAGVECRHYSYPEGLSYCYSDAVIDALQARGVMCCPTAEDGVNHPGVDLFHLKRIPVV